MIKDLRFVEREVAYARPDIGEDVVEMKLVRILQMKVDPYPWIDVPLVKEGEQ